MRDFVAFLKKEWMEQLRTGKFLTILIIFVFFGILSPAIAKLMPWIVKLNAEQLEESGLIIKEITVTALEAWTQFFKNVPIALAIFVLFQSNIFTKEYQKNTLVLAITKGLNRFKVVISKACVLLVLWSVGYWLSAGITYAYSVYFWDNSIIEHLGFSLVMWWLFGVMVVSLMNLFSVVVNTNANVIAFTGLVVVFSYFLSFIEKIKVFLPTYLIDGYSIVTGVLKQEDFTKSILVTLLVIVISFVMSVILMNKRRI